MYFKLKKDLFIPIYESFEIKEFKKDTLVLLEENSTTASLHTPEENYSIDSNFVIQNMDLFEEIKSEEFDKKSFNINMFNFLYKEIELATFLNTNNPEEIESWEKMEKEEKEKIINKKMYNFAQYILDLSKPKAVNLTEKILESIKKEKEKEKPFSPFGPNPFNPYQEPIYRKSFCTVCQIDMSKTMGYVCPNSACPSRIVYCNTGTGNPVFNTNTTSSSLINKNESSGKVSLEITDSDKKSQKYFSDIKKDLED